jgi:hypothetical protein
MDEYSCVKLLNMVVDLSPQAGLKNFVTGIWGKPAKKPRGLVEVFFRPV